MLARVAVAFLLAVTAACHEDGLPASEPADLAPADAAPDLACPAHLTGCGGSCVNLKTDNNNCGACGSVCTRSSVCTGGGCTCNCQAGYTNCPNAPICCVNLIDDTSNCGACGVVCPAGESCGGGVCSSCPSGLAMCSGRCVDLFRDPDNCGACGNTCPSGEGCWGRCGCPDETCNRVCVYTGNDPTNCGTCGNVCPAGTGCGFGVCK